MYTKSSGVEKYSKGCANEAFAARTTTVFVKPPLNHLSVTENSKKKVPHIAENTTRWFFIGFIIFLLNICLINGSVFRYVNT